MRSLLNKRGVATLALIGVLLVFMLGSARSMLADIISYRAFLQERYWASIQPVEDVKQWQAVAAQLKTSIALAPNNTEYYLFLGRLAGWRLFVNDEKPELPAVFQQGYAAFRIALADRPYWALGWSEFALFKAQLGEIDQEFEFAVYAAMVSGPFESRAILNTLNASFAAWDELSDNLKQDAAYMFNLSISLNYSGMKRKAIDLANHYQRLPVLCGLQGLAEASLNLCTSKKLRLSQG